MTDRPIIFSAPMVRALLDGRKMQTRRLAWGCPITLERPGYTRLADGRYWRPSPWTRVRAGDRLWVRENFYLDDDGDYELPVYATDNDAVKALMAHPDSRAHHKKLRPSIHMPRWASRITLTVTDVRRQPLQEITEEDARAEGISWSDEYEGYHTEECRHYHGAWPSRSFSSLWRSLHGEDAWDSNPEIVAVTFTVAQHNIDAPAVAARVA